jgi:hypothetical protein
MKHCACVRACIFFGGGGGGAPPGEGVQATVADGQRVGAVRDELLWLRLRPRLEHLPNRDKMSYSACQIGPSVPRPPAARGGAPLARESEAVLREAGGTSTSKPWRAKWMAASAPAGPAPATIAFSLWAVFTLADSQRGGGESRRTSVAPPVGTSDAGNIARALA